MKVGRADLGYVFLCSVCGVRYGMMEAGKGGVVR